MSAQPCQEEGDDFVQETKEEAGQTEKAKKQARNNSLETVSKGNNNKDVLYSLNWWH